MKRTPLKRKTRLVSRVKSKKVQASKLPPGPKRSQRGPVRDPAFLEAVRRCPCLYCGRRPSEPHHFERSGTGTKCSDYSTVPLCTTCHRFWHDHGTLPHGDRMSWIALFRSAAKKMKEEFDE